MPDRAALHPGGHHVTLNGIRHYYAVQGQGPLCILLPGGPGMHGSGYGAMGGLPAFLTLLTFHPRGSGESRDAPNGDYTLPAYARDLAALLDHLGRDQAIILGDSHGGMIAQRFAIDFPDRVEKLILADTAANLSEFSCTTWTRPWPAIAIAPGSPTPMRPSSASGPKTMRPPTKWANSGCASCRSISRGGAQYQHLRASRVLLPA